MSASTNAAAEQKYEEIASSYDDAYAGPRWEIYDILTMETAATHLPPPPARVLDAGAGSGKFALKFLALGHDVVLLDPSASMLARAREKVTVAGLAGRASFVEGTIESLEFPDASFDFVFSEGDPLSYCIDTHAQAARELVRVLRPGGGLYASLDNRWYAALFLFASGHAPQAFEAIERGRSKDPYGAPVHAFGAEELHHAFTAAGAVDVRVTGKVTLAHLLPDAVVLPMLGDPAARARLVAAELAASRAPSLAGLSGHLHVVGRKP